MSARAEGGRFGKGASGNPNGRPKVKKARIDTLEAFDDLVIDVANRPTVVTTAEGRQTIPLLKAMVIGLASGTTANRLGVNHAIKLTESALRRRQVRIERAAERERIKERSGYGNL